jgi:ABC-type multidrug transport system ATPase subunit
MGANTQCLTKEQFLPIYKKVIELDLVGKLQEYGTIMEFLSSIWELRTMRSHDDRYRDLYGDVKKHWVDNLNDYSDDDLFITRLGLLNSPELYQDFIEAIVDQRFIINEETRGGFRESIDEILKSYGFELAVFGYDDESRPKYMVTPVAGNLESGDIVQNQIPFMVVKNPRGFSHRLSSFDSPSKYPCFVLVSDDGWSDGYAHLQFNLYYFHTEKDYDSYGLVKIIKRESIMECSEAHHYYVKDDGLPDEFLRLPTDFCSLGQNEDYYKTIKRRFGEDYETIFMALNDVAVFAQIDDTFRNTDYYSCLIRGNEAERLVREALLILQGRDVADRYKFRYSFRPKYADNDIEFEFNFRDETKLIPRRIYAVIGKNGVGKTLFVTQLPLDLSDNKSKSFSPAKPILSKVISIANSTFDDFKRAKNTAKLNYYHFGLTKTVGDGQMPKSKDDFTAELLNATQKIRLYNRVAHLKNVLSKVVFTESIEELFVEVVKNEREVLDIDTSKLKRLMKKMSSGESTLLYLFMCLESEMRYDSLLLLDEPETHLHPDAIAELLTALDDMLEEYQSCCVMVTHSPLLVRELTSDCVYVMEREDKMVILRKPGIETIGSGLNTITDDIFGSKNVQRNYKKRLSELALYHNYEDLKASLESDDVPLSLGMDVYLRSLYQNRNNEEAGEIQ